MNPSYLLVLLGVVMVSYSGPLVKGGLLICSGIIREREADVQKAAKEAGYRQVDRIEKGEWVALCLKNEA